ncbi:MAG: sel1 repeat family protein [Ignavibacteriales bacterium]|nr:sel1 repeat family protein [Ignavibacteriales bacterium]
MYKNNLKILISLFVLISVTISFSQENTTQSEAFKKTGFSKKTQLFKPKYPSYSLAATYVLTEKARKGDPLAQHELGIRYILGIGVPLDTLEAAYWIGKAASKNLPAANFNFGIMQNSGIGVPWDPFSAYKNFKVAAESGMEQGQYIFGLLHTDNLIVNKNLAEAQKWLKKSANKGFEEAKKVLLEFQKQGLIVTQDSTIENLQNDESLIEENNFSALISNEYELDYYNFSEDSLSENEEKEILNKILDTKHGELKKLLKVKETKDLSDVKDTTAVNLIKLAAGSGSPEALLIEARLLEYGIGIKENLIMAAANYLKAFRLGSYKAAESLLKISQREKFFANLEKEVKLENPNAMYVWAGLIALGIDYSLTEEQAFELLQKAEKQNHINSIIELGLAYYSGSLVKKDSLKAVNYFNSAAKLGSSEAEVRLAFIRIQSSKLKDYKQELAILKKYSESGSVLAEAALAYCYENGIQVKENKGKASILYRKAAQRGNEAAFNSLRNMYDKLRPSDPEFQIYL